jgi:hypothetical protein
MTLEELYYYFLGFLVPYFDRDVSLFATPPYIQH